MLALQGSASPHMLAVMGQSADHLFQTVNEQLLRIFVAAEAVAAAGGGKPPSRGAKYALNIMLQVGAPLRLEASAVDCTHAPVYICTHELLCLIALACSCMLSCLGPPSRPARPPTPAMTAPSPAPATRAARPPACRA